MAVIRIGGTEFGYDEAGSGPAVVLVHAGCADRRMWDHQFRALSEHYRVIRYDWRGYGESGDATGEFAYHEDLLALLDASGVDRATLVGSSDGGRTALDAVLTAPERITALVLVAPGLSGHEWPPSMLARYRERVHDVIGIDRLRSYRAGEVETIDVAELEAYSAAETEFLVAGPGRTRDDLEPQVWELALKMDRLLNERSWTGPHGSVRGLRPPAKERLAEVEAPTLVVTGLADVPEILEVSDLLAREIRKVRRVDLPQTGHLPPLERPEEFTAILTDFLVTL
ncbi:MULTISPECIES: alpha/beta fold hydrolase [Streptosporangium]|uniref:Pimeloyl-ACP methyl ester carboxylesterase n=1 Tax=Streptosporangium brasiliense TaxID=47480 RepID=A0ABT9R3R1_9ACTN|nr:alpha/beta hydrolase [Streptosporangium brasiliense]MDP9863877.1 pimeloyl-ACP methyl ester carboxylesterase [Streptosporangium brasiliense]